VNEHAREVLKAFTMNGDQLTIHTVIDIHPKSYLQMPLDDRRRLVEICKKLEDVRFQPDRGRELRKEAFDICSKYRLSFIEDHEDDKNAVRGALRLVEPKIEEVKICGKTINSMEPPEVHRLDSVFRNECKNYTEQYIKVGHSFASKQGGDDIRDYCAAAEYAARRFGEAVKERRKEDNGRSDKGIYFNSVYSDLKDPTSSDFARISTEFKDLKGMCEPHNREINPRFKSPMMAANHYHKHGKKMEDGIDQYFKLAKNMTGSGVRVERMWTQDGSTIMCQYTNETCFAVTYYNPVLATMYRTHKKVRKSYRNERVELN